MCVVMTSIQTFDRTYMSVVSSLENLVQCLFISSFGNTNNFEMWIFNIHFSMIVPICDCGWASLPGYSPLYFKTWLNFDVRYTNR